MEPRNVQHVSKRGADEMGECEQVEHFEENKLRVKESEWNLKWETSLRELCVSNSEFTWIWPKLIEMSSVQNSILSSKQVSYIFFCYLHTVIVSVFYRHMFDVYHKNHNCSNRPFQMNDKRPYFKIRNRFACSITCSSQARGNDTNLCVNISDLVYMIKTSLKLNFVIHLRS